MSTDANGSLARLEALLGEEREAIVRLDSASVERATEEKQAILAALSEGPRLDAAQAAQLVALRPALQHNLVLLAHARDAVRDALAAMDLGASVTLDGRARTALRPASRLHVTG